MKYIDVDKLKAEIDNKLLHEQGFEDGDSEYGYKCALKDIKRVIAALQQEQPEVDFEGAYKSYMQSRKDDLSWNAVTVNVKDLARHFYELGRTRKE